MLSGFEKFIESPYTAMVATIIFSGLGFIALNGRYMTVGYILLIGGLCIAAVGLRGHMPVPVLISVLGFIGSTLILVGYFVTPEETPQNTGTLVREIVLAPNIVPNRSIEIGNSGAIINVGMIKFAEESSLVVEVEGSDIKVSTDIKDENGRIIAKLIKNNWSLGLTPRAFDRNYTRDALEVLDDRGKVVLQIRLLPDRIQLQGEWRGANGFGARLVSVPGKGGAIITYVGKPNPDDPEIGPIFMYPSTQYFGQLRGAK